MFALALIPVIGLVPLANPIAERYAYLGSLGFFMCVVTALGHWLARAKPAGRRRLVTGAALAVVVLLALRSLGLSGSWASDGAVWRNTLRYEPANAKGLNNLGVVYNDAGAPQKAIAVYQRNLQLHPDNLTAHRQLGLLYKAAGRDDDAAGIYYRLGRLYEKAGRPADAVRAYSDAYIASGRKHIEAAASIGRLLLRMGKPSDAVRPLARAVELDPGHFAARLDLASALLKIGKRADARRELEIAMPLARTDKDKRQVRALARQLDDRPGE